MFNQTIAKFGHPGTLVREYAHWLVLLRPAQVTAGSLVLAAKGEFTAYGALPAEAFAEQGQVIGEIERTMHQLVAYERINYLMLMMVDPHVHFHIIPRHQGRRTLGGVELEDVGWPGPPDLKSALRLGEEQIPVFCSEIRASWIDRLL